MSLSGYKETVFVTRGVESKVPSMNFANLAIVQHACAAAAHQLGSLVSSSCGSSVLLYLISCGERKLLSMLRG